MRATVAIVALSAAMIGCRDSASPFEISKLPASGVFTTDATSYTAVRTGDAFGQPTYSVRIVTRYTNPTSAPLYLARCYPTSQSPIFGVDLLGQADSWGAAYNPNWACVGHDQQILVAPGAVRIDTLLLQGPTAFDGHTGQAYGIMFGRFALSYFPQSCVGDGQCAIAADALRLSNEFTILLP